ncbi:MAG: DUF2500 domain-containing protein [Tyzzerella sp.]|nr:DUF2500 domain-containing protein [Tyzzerella sp.]
MDYFLQFQLILAAFVFCAILGGGLFLAIRRWIQNNKSEKLCQLSMVFEKRIHTYWSPISRKHGFSNRKEFLYYVTFQLENGECIEFCLNYRKSEYDRLKEGDKGLLHFQGTRYLGFEKAATKKKTYNKDGTKR